MGEPFSVIKLIGTPNFAKTLTRADPMEEEPVDEGLRSRRRLVQATLFPNSAKQIPVKGGAEEEEEDEEEEWCESQENGNKTKGKQQQKKKRNSKTTTPQSHPRASKKVNFVVSLLSKALELILLELRLI